MAPRLLTLLSLIETALVNQGSRAVVVAPTRSVSFHKGMARMSFSDGSGSILLQNFTLADGQICVRAILSWAGVTETGTHSIYPRDGFDWLGAAEQISTAWLAKQPLPVAGNPVAVRDEGSVSEQVAAAG